MERLVTQKAVAADPIARFTGAEVLQYRRCVYGLVDPREPDVIAYVGQTEGQVFVRYQGHLSEAEGCLRVPARAKVRRIVWLCDLLERGLLPDLVVLELVPEAESLDDAEQRWIYHYKRRGEAGQNRQLRLAAYLGFPECASGPKRKAVIDGG